MHAGVKLNNRSCSYKESNYPNPTCTKFITVFFWKFLNTQSDTLDEEFFAERLAIVNQNNLLL